MKFHKPAMAIPSIKILSLLIAIIVFIGYANIINAPFIFDDNNHIRENSRIHQLWPLKNVISATNRPVVDLTLAVNYRLGRLSTVGYHLFNVMVHILNALLFMAIVKTTFQSPRLKEHYRNEATALSFFAALLWAIHPIQTQSVTYIIQRSELLMALFYLSTLYSVLRLHRNPSNKLWGIRAVLFCALGMGSKEVMVTAPVVIFIYDRIFLSTSFKETIQKRGWVYIGLMTTWILLFRFVTTQRANAAIGGFSFNLVSPGEYAVSQPKVICHYIKLIFWPLDLCIDYQWPLAKTMGDIVPFVIIITGLVMATGWALRFRPVLGFLGVWFFFILGPTSSFMPIGDLAFDHRMYLSSMSIVILFVLGGEWIVKKLQQPVLSKKIYYSLFSITGMILVILTLQRNQIYQNEIALWRDVMHKRPENIRAYLNLGVALSRENKLDEAEKYLRQALKWNPMYAKVYFNLASIMQRKGDREQAKELYEEAIRVQPDFAFAYLALGILLKDMNDYRTAEPYFKKFVELMPQSSDGFNHLGFVMFKMGRLAEAKNYYEKALANNPQNISVYYNLALLYAEEGQLDSSVEYFTKVLAANPQHVMAHFNLGTVLARQGKFLKALDHFQECMRLNPEFRPAYQRFEQIKNFHSPSIKRIP